MPAPQSEPTLRQLLDVKSAELRQAGNEVAPGPLAERLIEAKELTPTVALQLARDYLLAETESRAAAAAQHLLSRRARAWVSGLALAVIGAFLWFEASSPGWEPPLWFVVFILGLAGMNLLVWTLEPVGQVEKPDCAGCGAPRRPDAREDCPVCGSRELERPRVRRVGRVALWAVALFSAGRGAFFSWGAVQDPPNRVEFLTESLGWLLVSAAGAREPSALPCLSGRNPPDRCGPGPPRVPGGHRPVIGQPRRRARRRKGQDPERAAGVSGAQPEHREPRANPVRAFSSRIREARLSEIKVTIWESASAWAAYTESL